jgi:undecaprenyl-diphosphatase
VPIPLPSVFERFDKSVEQRWASLRGQPIVDRVAYTASEVGDFGVIWMFIAALHALTGSSRHGKALVRIGCALAFESVVVNQGLKRLFKRGRPTVADGTQHALRKPLTSSFPSGHTTSAVTAAILLRESSPIPSPVLFGAAAAVAASRVHTKMHHPTDVAGGLVVGALMGYSIKRLLPLSQQSV